MTNEIRYQMIQSNTKLNTLAEEDELKHYGVLGMKWGVRRYQKYGEGGYMPKGKAIAQKTYNKSIKKLDKLDSKAESAKAKSAALKARGTDLAYKGQKQQTFALTEIGYAKGQKNSMKGSKLIAKSAKKDREAIKAEQKADKWSKKMLENLKGIPAELSDAQKRTLEKHNLKDLIKKEEPVKADVKKEKPIAEEAGLTTKDGQYIGVNWNYRKPSGDTIKSINHIVDNIDGLQSKAINKAADLIFDKNGNDNIAGSKMSKDEFKKSVKVKYIDIKDDGKVTMSLWGDSEDHPIIADQYIDVTYDPNTKKMGKARITS